MNKQIEAIHEKMKEKTYIYHGMRCKITDLSETTAHYNWCEVEFLEGKKFKGKRFWVDVNALEVEK